MHRYITSHQKFNSGISFYQTTLLCHFLGTLGINGGREGQKSSISLKMTLRSCRFAQRYNLSLQTWCRHLFKTNYKFWPFLRGHLEGHISYFSKSNPSNAANLYRQVIFRQRFDTVTDLGQMTQFYNLLRFLGHPGDQTGIKKSQSFMLTVVRSTCHRHC